MNSVLPAIGAAFLRMVRTILYAFGFLLMVAAFGAAGPILEAAFNPIIKDFRVVSAVRTDGKVTFTVRLNKVRDCRIIPPISWEVRLPGSDVASGIVVTTPTGQPAQGTTFTPGPLQLGPYVVTLPTPEGDPDRYKDGGIIYSDLLYTCHGLWDIRQRFGPIQFGPVEKIDVSEFRGLAPRHVALLRALSFGHEVSLSRANTLQEW